MAQPVWVLSVDLQSKTATFQSGMATAAKSARSAFTEIKSGASEMSDHIGGGMFASRHAIMAVTESLGVQMPRAITALLVHIEPLGAALEAAFPFAAIALGAVLLTEHLESLKAEGIKLTEDQVKFGTAVQTVFNQLDQHLITSGIKADELRNDHLGALHLQLKLIDAQSMDELVHSLGEVAKAADVVFADLKTSWYQFGIGSAGAKHALDEFQTKYDDLLAKGKDKEASDLLKGTRESAEKVLEAQKQIAAANAGTDKMGLAVGTQAKDQAAANQLKAAGVGYTEKEVKAQQTLVDALNAQLSLEGKVAALKTQDKSNATTSTGKEMSALAAAGAKEAADHQRKMGELRLQIEKEQSEASLSMKESSIAERLAADVKLADEEYKVAEAGNAALIAALDKGGKDYNNQLKGLQDKALELTQQHAVTLAGLNTKATVAQYRLDLQTMEEGEREKIEATLQGSAARLAAIDAAIKEEQSKNLQETSEYRELLKQRVQAQREYTDESGKLTAEAGKQRADTDEKTALTALESQHNFAQLVASLARTSAQQQLNDDLAFAQQEFSIKQQAAQQELAALDKADKDYLNKKQELQNKIREMTQQNDDAEAQMAAKSAARQQAEQNAAMAAMENSFAQSFLRVLEGHESFARMMTQASQQLVGNLVQAGIALAAHVDDAKLSDARAAARQGFVWGTKYGGPAAPVVAPAMAATFFAGVMAFQDGTDMVPGIGKGDKVPAMLEPGEGVVPGGVMDGLGKMARSGHMGGGDTYHLAPVFAPVVHAIDADGVGKMLTEHADEFHRHFQRTIRKMNK